MLPFNKIYYRYTCTEKATKTAAKKVDVLFDAKFNAHKKYKLKKYGMQNYIIYIYIYIYISSTDCYKQKYIPPV